MFLLQSHMGRDNYNSGGIWEVGNLYGKKFPKMCTYIRDRSKWNSQIMGETEPHMDISCHQILVLGLVTISINCWPKGPHGNPQRIQAVSKTIGCSLHSDRRPITEDSTYTTHWKWRNSAGAYTESSPLWTSVFGIGRYSSCYQKGNINTKPATKL